MCPPFQSPRADIGFDHTKDPRHVKCFDMARYSRHPAESRFASRQRVMSCHLQGPIMSKCDSISPEDLAQH
jgi:hypothetical protein